MAEGKRKQKNMMKRWIITVGIFLIVQVIFMMVDGTSMEPNINDSGALFARMGRAILNSQLFTEWINPYSFPFFNLLLTVHVISILIMAAESIFQIKPKK